MKKGGGSESTIIIGPSKSVLIYALHSLEYVLGLARFRVFVPKNWLAFQCRPATNGGGFYVLLQIIPNFYENPCWSRHPRFPPTRRLTNYKRFQKNRSSYSNDFPYHIVFCFHSNCFQNLNKLFYAIFLILLFKIS